MKVLLLCAGGMSTSMVMKKLRTYAQQNGIEDFSVDATAVSSFYDVAQDYDVVLLGPQVSYKRDELAEQVPGKPVGVIAPQDYAIANCEHIFKQINELASA